MVSLSGNNQTDNIEAFISTSRYLDEYHPKINAHIQFLKHTSGSTLFVYVPFSHAFSQFHRCVL